MVEDTREFREGAEIAVNYLRYLNYSIEHKQIPPNYILQINMQWIKHCNMLKEKYPAESLPVCYYLYSFEGALSDKHWDDIGDKRKRDL